MVITDPNFLGSLPLNTETFQFSKPQAASAEGPGDLMLKQDPDVIMVIASNVELITLTNLGLAAAALRSLFRDKYAN